MSDGSSAHDQATSEEEVRQAFRQVVNEGVRRLERSWPSLLATGTVGGIDVSIGVFGLMVVTHLTGNKVLGALAFTFGFIALELGRSELFTENYLVPIAALVARREGIGAVLRLWGGTAVMNLAGGWAITAIVMAGFPQLNSEAVKLGVHFVDIGFGWRSFAMAMMAGAVITVMTWMIEATASAGTKIVAASFAGFLLTAGEMNHCIVASLEMFAALIAGAPFGYLDWFLVFLWAALGNTVGGIGLVTLLRFAQVGGQGLREETEQQAARDDQRAAST
ncbi:MAG: formate/nitrite transporter family protein [Actinomycetota bacterium]|nr:formate/nitrite transporter family protein [Actinomycetota bacterium]